MKDIKVYGADWCPGTQHALARLKQLGMPFEYINVEENREASGWVKAQSGGKERKPTLDIGGKVLVEPTERELDSALRE